VKTLTISVLFITLLLTGGSMASNDLELAQKDKETIGIPTGTFTEDGMEIMDISNEKIDWENYGLSAKELAEIVKENRKLN
jgi:hypothetical protein